MWWVGQRTWNFYQTLVLVLAFKKCIVEFSAIFVCLLLDDLSDSEINERASSTVGNFKNNWPLLVTFFRNNKPFPKYLTHRKLKMSAVFIFEIKDVKMDKIFNFLKDHFAVICGPMDIILSYLQGSMWNF